MNESCIHIRGNHDRQLIDRPRTEMGASDRAARTQLSTRHLEWLASLPPSQTLEDQIFLCHGSPRSDLEYLLEDLRDDRVLLSSADEILPRLNGVNASLILC